MEFLLPVALKLFPNMLPSTFETKSKKVSRSEYIIQQYILKKLELYLVKKETRKILKIRYFFFCIRGMLLSSLCYFDDLAVNI